MNDIVCMKNKSGLFWGRHPYIMFVLTSLVGAAFMFFMIFSDIDSILIVNPISTTILPVAAVTIFSMHCNRAYHRTENMAFVVRDGVLYSIGLIYTNKPLGTEVEGGFVYTPSGSLLELAALKHNLSVANNVQTHEREVMERGRKAQSYIHALNEILDSLDVYPYETYPDESRTGFGKYMYQNFVNKKEYIKATKGDEYNLLILNNPEVIKVTRKKVVIRYTETTGEEGIATYSNCFDGLVDAINKLNGSVD